MYQLLTVFRQSVGQMLSRTDLYKLFSRLNNYMIHPFLRLNYKNAAFFIYPFSCAVGFWWGVTAGLGLQVSII